MSQFRKKPVVIEASQWHKNGDHPMDYAETTHGYENGALRPFTGEYRKTRDWEGAVVRYFRHPEVSGETACKHCGGRMHDHGWIETLEGGHIVCPGDWIITGVAGERYPCKPDIFAATYDAAQGVGLSFGQALEAIKAGKRLARDGWNGKGMFVYLVPPASYPAQTGAAKAHFGEGALIPYAAYFAIKNANDTVSTWVPSINDCLAEDWRLVE